MQELDDIALLREYADNGSEEAFATLVARHVNKVYSVALRQTGNPHQAEEITQTVFVILAGKARRLGKGVILEGWLYQTARLTALSVIRGEIRRARREQESHVQTTVNENESEVWTQISPLLEPAIASLNESDRHAVVLRFFYGKSMKEVGAALGGSEGAATLRVHRALEKLRQFFVRRGVVSTTAIIAAAITANSVQAAPATLAKSIATVAVAKSVATGGSSSPLLKSALKVVAGAKMKVAAVAVTGVLLAVGGTEIYNLSQHLQHAQSTTVSGPGILRRSSWVFSGFATPESTIETCIWAKSVGDTTNFLAAQTPESVQVIKETLFKKTTAQQQSQFIIASSKPIEAIRIKKKEILPDGQVALHLVFDGFPFPLSSIVTFTNINDEWKIAEAEDHVGNVISQFPPPKPLTKADFAPRAGSELQGFWKGEIHTRHGQLHVNLKIAESSSGKFRAESYSLDQGAIRTPAKVSRDGKDVTVTPMNSLGMFEVKLRNGGKEMAGNWIQNGQRVPATFVRGN